MSLFFWKKRNQGIKFCYNGTVEIDPKVTKQDIADLAVLLMTPQFLDKIDKIMKERGVEGTAKLVMESQLAAASFIYGTPTKMPQAKGESLIKPSDALNFGDVWKLQ